MSNVEYEPGDLPPDFHRRVVDLEIKVEMHGVSKQDNEGQIKLLSDLMQLYSVSSCPHVCNQLTNTSFFQWNRPPSSTITDKETMKITPITLKSCRS